MTAKHRMDDVLWDEVWERNLGPVERHNVALGVWRRTAPNDPFEVLVGWELAHRWRARARNLAVLYGGWSVFWAALTSGVAGRAESAALGVTVSMTVLGIVGVVGCLAFRRRLRPILDGRTGFAPAGPATTTSALH